MDKKMTPRQLVGRVLLPGVVLLLVLWACNAPSFPLPPPGPENFAFEQQQQGVTVLRLAPNDRVGAGFRVEVFNLDRRQGVFGYAEVDGSFESLPFYATEGEIIQFSFHDPDEEGRGGSTCLVVSFDATPVTDPRCGDFQ
jgi:hypothetical protein